MLCRLSQRCGLLRSRAGDESNVAWPRYTKMQHGAQPMGHRAEWGGFDSNEGPRGLEIRVLYRLSYRPVFFT